MDVLVFDYIRQFTSESFPFAVLVKALARAERSLHANNKVINMKYATTCVHSVCTKCNELPVSP